VPRILTVITDPSWSKIRLSSEKHEVYYITIETRKTSGSVDDDRDAAKMFYSIVNYYLNKYDYFLLVGKDSRIIAIAEDIGLGRGSAPVISRDLFMTSVRLLHIRGPAKLRVYLDDRVFDRVTERVLGYLPVYKLVILPRDEVSDYMTKRDVVHPGYAIVDKWDVYYRRRGRDEQLF